jgi:hypothetical protein
MKVLGFKFRGAAAVMPWTRPTAAHQRRLEAGMTPRLRRSEMAAQLELMFA